MRDMTTEYEINTLDILEKFLKYSPIPEIKLKTKVSNFEEFQKFFNEKKHLYSVVMKVNLETEICEITVK